MAPSADTIIASLHKDKRNPQLAEEVSIHLKSLQSNYDIACFSTKVANEVFRDLSTASQDSSLILLQCAYAAISHLETVPDSYITKSLKPLGLEKLWQRLISKQIEKSQYTEAKKHLTHLNERLQSYQSKTTGPSNTGTPANKSSKGKQVFAPHSSDSTEFRNCVVSVITLEVQLAFASGEGLDHVLAVMPKWNQWLLHLAEKDAAQAHPQTDAMVRLLFSRLSKRLGDPLLLKCLEGALDCLVYRRNSFFDIANVFASQFYEKQTSNDNQKQLLAFHTMVAAKDSQLPSPQSLDVDYVLWAVSYASALMNASSFKKCAALLQDAFSHIQSYPSSDISQAASALVSVWACINRLHESDFGATIPHLQTVIDFTRSLPSISISSSSTPQTSLLSTKTPAPSVYTLLLRITKSIEELRNFYSLRLCSLRRKADAKPDGGGAGDETAGDAGITGTAIPSDMLRLLRRVIMGLVEVVDKGITFDGALSKAGEKVEVFAHFRSIQVEALHASAQLHYECDGETVEKLTTYYKRALTISAQIQDKRKATCLSNLIIRSYHLGNVLFQKNQYKAAIPLLEFALQTTSLDGNQTPIASATIYALICCCYFRMGNLEGTVAAAEAGLKCSVSVNATLAPGSPLCNLLEQFVAASCKLDHGHLSGFSTSFSSHVAVLEETLKIYQRIAPASYQHQLAVVDAILSACDPKNHPIKHGRALIEKAKLIRFCPNSEVPEVLLDSAINLIQSSSSSSQLCKDEPLSQCVMDELAKAHMWQAFFIQENHREYTKAVDKTKHLAKALKHVQRGVALWSTLADSLVLPDSSPSKNSEDSVAHNKCFFVDPAVSVRVMKTGAELVASVDDVESQVQLLELASQFAHHLSLPLYDVASVHLALAEVYSGGGYTTLLDLHLQRAEALLVQYQQNTQKTQQQQLRQSPQALAQAQQYARAVRHAKLLRLQFGLENGDILSLETMDDLAEELDANKKNREDLILLAWLKRIRASLTYTPPQLAMQDAKDSFSLIVYILPEYQPSSTTTPTSMWTEANISRWQLVRHFIASVECVVQSLEQAGKPQEAYVVYSRALSVVLRAGAVGHIGRVSLGMGELEYYRHHWSQAKRLLRRAQDAFRDCASLRPQTTRPPAKVTASNELINKHMMSLGDMRLGDVYRRIGQLSKADRHYKAAHSTVSELPQYLAVASQTRCADASPREARILGKLERANKQVQLMSRGDARRSKKPARVSDSSSSADTSSGDEGTTKRTTRSRQVKLNPKGKGVSKSTRKKAPSSDSEEEEVKPLPTKRSTKTRKPTKNSDEDDGSTKETTKKHVQKSQDLPLFVSSLLARLEGKLARVDILRGQYSEAVQALSLASQKEATPVTLAVLQLHTATAHMMNTVAGNAPLSPSGPPLSALVDSLSCSSKCLIPSLRSRICHTIADLDGEHAASISVRQQLCQVSSFPKPDLKQDESVDTLSRKLGNMTVKESKPKSASSKSKKAATTADAPNDTRLPREEELARHILLSSEYSTTHFTSLYESLPPDWVVCSKPVDCWKICVPRGQQALWISRVQAGQSPLTLKIPLKALRADKGKGSTDADDFGELLGDSDEEQESDVSTSSSEQDDAKKETDWDTVDKGTAIDEFLSEDNDSDEDDAAEESSPACSEDAFVGTELGEIVATTQRIIEVSNITAKKQVTTNKQKQQWWENRKKLDAKMKEVVNNMETSVLGWRKAILVPPPSDKFIRDALLKAADTLESELTQPSADSDSEDDTERKPARTKLAATKGKAKTPSAPARKKQDKAKNSPVTPPINRPLLETCLCAVPFLSDSEIGSALEAITGRAVEHKWVAMLRNAYNTGVGASATGKKRTSTKESKESEALGRQTLVLALDGKLQRLPWESLSCLDSHCITRVPSLLYANILYTASARLLRSGINAKRAFYLLNASGDLTKTQECFEVQFKRRIGWQGIVGARPTAEEYKQALSEHELFVYCGHGSGEQYLKRDAVARLPKCGVALLMGCSSGYLCDEGDFEPTGMANSFLVALSPSVVGNLWDVTDGELDRLTNALLGNWLDQGMPLPLALAQARKTCQFRFLVAAAAVCYGVPICVSS